MTPPRTARPPTLRAALFDYDGTLFDTDPIHWRCWNAALQQFGADLDRHTYDTSCAGRPSLQIAAQLAANARLAVAPEAIVMHKEAAFADWLRTGEVVWMPGAQEAFARFQARGLKLAVVTSSPRQVVTVGLRQRGILDVLDVLITREDVARQKPAPDAYAGCVQRLGLVPQVCLAFEDSASGVQSATAAGLRCLAVRPPQTGAQDLSAAERQFTTWQAATDWALGAG